jgi:hypothetical protein
MPRDALDEALEIELVATKTSLLHRARHAVHDARRFLLRENGSARRAQGAGAAGTVVSHSGEHHSEGGVSERLCGALEENIHRRTVHALDRVKIESAA